MLSYVQTAVMLAGVAALGVAAHELSHVAALRLVGISYTVEVAPERDDTEQFSTGLGESLARVSPVRLPDDISPWSLRVAALMPLCLALPLALIFVGVFPNPFAADALAPKLALIVWLGCSIPSPQDFSVAWYPGRAIETARDG